VQVLGEQILEHVTEEEDGGGDADQLALLPFALLTLLLWMVGREKLLSGRKAT